MIQQIYNIKKLFQRHKPEAETSAVPGHGTRCILHVTNLALFGVAMILTIASTLIYFLVPITKVSELNKMIDAQKVESGLDTESTQLPVQKVESGLDTESAQLPGMFSIDTESATADSKNKEAIGNDAFSVINERNMFSQNRKEWVASSVIPRSSKKRVRGNLSNKRALGGKPKKIILHGVIIAGDLRKALINNPLKGVSKKKTLYVEEGDELEGYMVTSIEKDRIRLDWHGEEIVVMLYSGLNDIRQGSDAGKVNQGGITEFDYKFKVVEDIKVDEVFDKVVVKVEHENMPDKNPFNLVYKEPDYFSMPVFEYTHVPKVVEKQEIAELFSDAKSNNEGFFDKNQETVKIEKSEPIDLVAEEGLDKESLSGKTSEILLNGIVIVEARDIKKALVNIPMPHSSKGRTLSVEEGDSFEGYKVTSIEPDRLRLDWQGEEVVLTAYSGLKHFNQGGNEGIAKQESLAKLDTKLKVVENAKVEKSIDEGVIKVANKDMSDKNLLNLVYKKPDYFSMPAFEYTHVSKDVEKQEIAESFSDAKSSNEEFSNEKQETVKIEKSELVELVAEEGLNKESLSGNTPEILLNGIVLVEARGIKKALVNIPMPHSSKGRTLSVEEGDVFEGYKVTSIEHDRLRLDWHGEEVVLTAYSGLRHIKQGGNEGIAKQEGLAKLDTKFKVVENAKVEKSIDEGVIKVANKDMSDKNLLNLVYKEPDYFSMPAFEYTHVSKVVEKQEIVESFSDAKSNNEGFSNKKQETVKIEKSEPVALVTEEGLKQEPLSGKPLEILLNGIVIVEARDIKKALVDIPMSHSGKYRTLSVEEGDVFEGYKVTSIEPDRLRLDWHGEKVVVTTYSGLKHFKEGGSEGEAKPESLAGLDTKFKVVEDVKVEEGFDKVVVKIEHEDVQDESSLSLEYKEPEYFAMSTFKDSDLSETDEIQVDDVLFPFCSFPD